MLKRLSYTMNVQSPGWPGNPTLSIEPFSQIKNGDDANVYTMTMLNHFGSHMDGPRHFNDKGPRLAELSLDTFFYEKPVLIDIPKTYEQLMLAEDFEPFAERIKEADVLFIRSGFSEKRETDPEGYSARGPGISAEASKYLMDEFPNLKAVALDWISLASYAHGEDGVLSHQYLLGKFHDHYICIIEDLDFTGLEADTLKRVWSIPLFMEVVDSSPVTVIAEIADK